ncbi:ATP-binding protein [Planosporangium sp. 12N6]|uniref:ATP-binding protein n=1 Tax=Planosporangium spinosum TaxID=3402278 RepID=UPI003CF3A9DF
MTDHLPAVAAAEAGRDRWLEGRRQRLHTAREWLLSGGSALLFGPAGVGKSAALDLVTAAATRSRVLRFDAYRPEPGRPSVTRRAADRPYAALAALFGAVGPADLAPLPASRRDVLGALMAGDAEALPPAAVRLAVLNLVRFLARSRPLLLAVDDLQGVDPASADVLRFVSTRVDDVPVQLAATERVAPGALPVCRGLCPSPLLVVRLEPVDAGERG